MSQVMRRFFVDSVSSATVQLRRVPGSVTLGAQGGGDGMHAITVTTGNLSDTNADTGFWQATCTQYEVIIRRLS